MKNISKLRSRLGKEAAQRMRRQYDFAGVNARKTHCVNGHAFTPENTRVNSDGSRHCKACERASNRRSYARKLDRDDPEGIRRSEERGETK
jgi:hypothetical protein